MKRIIKQEVSKELQGWIDRNRYKWKNWDKAQEFKRKIKSHLIKEQGGLCCYCEREIKLNNKTETNDKIATDDKSNFHIEHLKPKSKYPQFQFDLNNLLLSCSGEEDEIHKKCNHCGHAKGNKYDPSKFISPLNPDCEEKFRYLEDGQIIASDLDQESPANYTIKLLKLNSPVLRKHREELISTFYDLQTDPSDALDFPLDIHFLLSKEEQCSLAKKWLERRPDGSFNPYWTTIKYLFANE